MKCRQRDSAVTELSIFHPDQNLHPSFDSTPGSFGSDRICAPSFARCFVPKRLPPSDAVTTTTTATAIATTMCTTLLRRVLARHDGYAPRRTPRREGKARRQEGGVETRFARHVRKRPPPSFAPGLCGEWGVLTPLLPSALQLLPNVFLIPMPPPPS